MSQKVSLLKLTGDEGQGPSAVQTAQAPEEHIRVMTPNISIVAKMERHAGSQESRNTAKSL